LIKGGKMKNFMVWMLVGIMFLFLLSCEENENNEESFDFGNLPYNIIVNPANFETINITGNTYFPIIQGTTLHYQGFEEEEDSIMVSVHFTTQTKEIMGVTCVTIVSNIWENGELSQESEGWYAQDLEGNVWCFGTNIQEIEDGGEEYSDESWEAGINGALPGIMMFNNPFIGVWYRLNYWEDEVEDIAQILSISDSLTVPFGSFNNCLQTAEWNLLEQEEVVHKYYAPVIGLIKTEMVDEEECLELVDITND